jgi:N-acyl-D-aspartate/D-glutamate deacylase
MRKLIYVFLLLISSTVAYAQQYDLVLEGGRVMDPETGLDAVRNVGIADGTIVAVSESALDGEEVLNVKDLVVAPGFIDLHAHGQEPVSNRLQAMDGVTTALELEIGAYPVADWLKSRDGKALLNYGATAGHPGARIKLFHDIDIGSWTLEDESDPNFIALTEVSDYAYKEATSAEVEAILALLNAGLDEGGLGIGVGIAYTPGASREEIFRVFELASKRRVPIYVHLRAQNAGGPLGGFQEVISDAASTGASLHIVHINSSADELARTALAMIRGAVGQGIDVTTEAYPYTASSPPIDSALFDAWEGKSDADYALLQWPATGERLNAESFRRYREEGGWVILHGRSEETNEWITAQSDVMVASDGVPYYKGPAHPRGAGSFARVLGYYVRERNALSLMDGLRKMTLLPAERVSGAAPQMKKKGRIQVGADADITVFDPTTIIDRATYERGDLPSGGIPYVLVGGTFVVYDGESVDGVFPGTAIVRAQ